MTQNAIPGVTAPYAPTEKEFQQQVCELAKILGWTIAHFAPALTKHGWRTPARVDGAGFPDLVLTGRGRTIFRELKTDRGRLSDDQKAWQTLLKRNGADVAVWRPMLWPEITRDLGAHDG
jgi:hypothetical protein